MATLEYRSIIMFGLLLSYISNAVVSAFILDTFLKDTGQGVTPNIVCIAEHCRNQAVACGENADCRSNMECVIKCGLTNNTCVYRCTNTYENSIFDAMMKCMVDDYGCLVLEPENPEFRCNPPSAVVKDFSLSNIEGSWYIVRGLNRDYDCFDCQISTYTPSQTSKNYTLTEKYDGVMANGSVRHRVVIQQVEQNDPDNGGLLDYTDTLMGLTMYEKWQVLYYADSGQYMIVYYCGHMSKNWWYDGGLVYSRNPVLGPLDVANIASVLKSTTGHTLDQYCAPNTQGCQI